MVSKSWHAEKVSGESEKWVWLSFCSLWGVTMSPKGSKAILIKYLTIIPFEPVIRGVRIHPRENVITTACLRL